MKVEQGVTFVQNMTWKIDSNAVNLSGYTARMNVRTSRSGRVPANILVLAITSDDAITLGGAAGTIRIDLINPLDSLSIFPDANLSYTIW